MKEKKNNNKKVTSKEKKTNTKKEQKTQTKNIKKEVKEEKTKNKPKKTIIIYLALLIVDIIMIIYAARHNFVNYTSMPGMSKILIGNNKKLFFGRNYINIIITIFFSIYTLLCNKYILKIKNTKKLTISLIIFYLILNIALFYLFTKRIY